MKKLYIDVANTYIKREKGLMGCKKLAKNRGMLFEFPYAFKLGFWMRNTYVPLDIAFIDDHGKILQIKEMAPLSTKAVRSDYKCKYALEVNRGWFHKNKVKEGDYITSSFFKQKKIAQSIENPPVDFAPHREQQVPQETQDINPIVMLNRSFKEIIEDAEIHGKDLIIIYETKAGVVLPPKVISPPFEFKSDEDGRSKAIVTAWDNQTGNWKSFIIDNIIDLEEKNEGNSK